MALVCLDTNTIIWGIKKECTPGQEIMLEKAKQLFKSFSEAKDHVLVPAVVVGEILCGTPPERHEGIIRALQDTSARVVPYDMNAARFNAKIWQEQRSDLQQMISSGQSSRQAVKTDIMIVAIALAQRCHVLYTEDHSLYKLSKPYLESKYVSQVTTQLGMLSE